MFIFLSKFLPLFLYPLGLACLLLGAGLIAARHDPRLRLGLALALGLLMLGGNRWVSAGLVRSLEWRYLPQEEISPAQAIVILGGGTEPAQFPRPTVEVNEAGDRVLYGGQLYLQGKAPLVLVTGGHIPSLIHMPRSVALFRHQGFQVVPAPTDFTVTAITDPNLPRPGLEAQIIALVPTAGNLEDSSDALKEYLGLLIYRLRGWI